MSKGQLHESGLAHIGTQPARIFHIFVVSKFGVRKALKKLFEFFFSQCPGISDEERRARRLGEFDEIFPAIRIILRFPHHAGYFFIIHVTVESTHTMPFDESDHIVFEAGQIVRCRSHKKVLNKSALYDFCWMGTRGDAC